MSIKSDDANFLTITCIRICLKMNQQSSRQRRSVPRWRTQLRRQILKQRWEDWFLLSYISLTHFCVQELPEIEPVAITSTTKECTSVEDRVMETNPKASVRGLIHIVENPAISDAHLNPEIVWKSPGGRSLNSTVFHGRRERGLKGVAVCSSLHTSSIDTRGSWRCSENHGSMRGAMRGL